MPLRCIEPETNRTLQAFDLSPEEWQALGAENRRRHHLRMPCCSAQVSLRRSRLGKPFFAHKTVGACSTGPETEAHRLLKQMMVEVARDHGWKAETEVLGEAPSGEPWRADVLASRGAARVAVEIQWSSQAAEETVRRQERYAASGIRCLWLFRQRSFPISEAVPAARILGTLEAGFRASLPDIFGRGRQELPMQEFLVAVLCKRLRFGLPLDVQAKFTVRAARLPCWRCHAQTQILKEVEVRAGPYQTTFSLSKLGSYRGLWDSVRARVPSSFPSGVVRRRYSKAEGREHLGNSCSHCGVSTGEHFEDQASEDVRVICDYTARLDEAWRTAIHHQAGSLAQWGVY
jgi:competence protein CoiA